MAEGRGLSMPRIVRCVSVLACQLGLAKTWAKVCTVWHEELTFMKVLVLMSSHAVNKMNKAAHNMIGGRPSSHVLMTVPATGRGQAGVHKQSASNIAISVASSISLLAQPQVCIKDSADTQFGTHHKFGKERMQALTMAPSQGRSAFSKEPHVNRSVVDMATADLSGGAMVKRTCSCPAVVQAAHRAQSKSRKQQAASSSAARFQRRRCMSGPAECSGSAMRIRVLTPPQVSPFAQYSSLPFDRDLPCITTHHHQQMSESRQANKPHHQAWPGMPANHRDVLGANMVRSAWAWCSQRVKNGANTAALIFEDFKAAL